jgi:holo-[acyl-carrier protein] synthase
MGIDLVSVSRVGESISMFGDKFLQRVFTPDEIAYARSAADGGLERLAARFAAKEAAIKALGLAGLGAGWRDIEVRRAATGAVTLEFHGRVATHVRVRRLAEVSLSLSHDGDWATAVVAARFGPNLQ